MPDNKRYTPQASTGGGTIALLGGGKEALLGGGRSSRLTGGRSGAKENRQEIEEFCGKIIFRLHISKKKCTFALAFSEFN